MSLPVAFLRVAQREYDHAIDYYESARIGLGLRFETAINRVLDRISELPDTYPEVHVDAREAVISGFPYCLYYRVEPTRIVVISVFHSRRDPMVWQGRV